MPRIIHRRSNIVLPLLYAILITAGLTLPYLYDGWIEYAGPALLLPALAHTAIKLIPVRVDTK